jgi:hypothetical protein
VTFRVGTDDKARAWLESRPAAGALVIAYDVQRCCGGGRICQVKVRERSTRDDPARYQMGALEDGSLVMIDRRAAARLPNEFKLTVRGLGRLRHLDLDLPSEQWGDLLYT